MRPSNFSKNELKYIKNPREMEKEYSKNYIYQIRHTIKHRIACMVSDIKILNDYGGFSREEIRRLFQ